MILPTKRSFINSAPPKRWIWLNRRSPWMLTRFPPICSTISTAPHTSMASDDSRTDTSRCACVCGSVCLCVRTFPRRGYRILSMICINTPNRYECLFGVAAKIWVSFSKSCCRCNQFSFSLSLTLVWRSNLWWCVPILICYIPIHIDWLLRLFQIPYVYFWYCAASLLRRRACTVL